MTGLIILAAGSSSRLGKPKQNLVYKGHTLLQRAVETGLSSVCKPVVVVLGANSEVIIPTIKKEEITVVQNSVWPEGMASSIRAGVAEIKNLAPNINSVILMLCDQPFVSSEVLNRIAKISINLPAGIIASAYNDTIGPPVLFDQKYFDELLLLKGQEGAKTVMLKHHDSLTSIPFPEGGIDIDTVSDYENLI